MDGAVVGTIVGMEIEIRFGISVSSVLGDIVGLTVRATLLGERL